MSNFERENLTGRNQEGPNANTPVERLTATSIIGDNIRNQQGEDLGEIKNLMINVHSGVIEYVVVQFGGVLGIGDKLFAVPYNQMRIDPENKRYILNRDQAFLKKAPGFDKDHWPGTNDHYYGDVVSYWDTAAGERPTPGVII
jgi:sporulation protein YlmC with PRC-barrel domain